MTRYHNRSSHHTHTPSPLTLREGPHRKRRVWCCAPTVLS